MASCFFDRAFFVFLVIYSQGIIKMKRLKKEFELYQTVKLKSKFITGVIVSISSETPPAYLVEVNEEFKTGEVKKDLIWLESKEIEPII